MFSLAVATTLAVNIAQADVTVQERLAVEGQGIMSMANMSGVSTKSISGKRSRVESDLQMESRLMRTFARGMGPHSEIVRLDDDKVYDINTKKKEYTESSLAARRAQLEKATEQSRQAQEKQPAPTGIDESQCDWSEPTAEVNKTGAKATIAGYPAEQVSVVAKQSCKDRKTGSVCDIALMLDEWLAPGLDAGDEVTKFNAAYAQQMGLATGGRDVTERAQALFGRYKGAWAKVADKMRDIKGYPVKTSFAFGMGGAQCHGESASGSSEQSANTGGGAASGPTPGGLAGQIAGSLFGRKKKQEEAQPAAAATPAAPLPAGMSNMVVPLKITAELISIDKNSLSASTFEVPAGFKKVSE
jgi:hypothetical protein